MECTHSKPLEGKKWAKKTLVIHQKEGKAKEEKIEGRKKERERERKKEEGGEREGEKERKGKREGRKGKGGKKIRT